MAFFEVEITDYTEEVVGGNEEVNIYFEVTNTGEGYDEQYVMIQLSTDIYDERLDEVILSLDENESTEEEFSFLTNSNDLGETVTVTISSNDDEDEADVVVKEREEDLNIYNNIKSYLSENIMNTDNQIVLQDELPDRVYAPFKMTINWRENGGEILEITGIQDDRRTLEVLRGMEHTEAQYWEEGVPVELLSTAGYHNELVYNINKNENNVDYIFDKIGDIDEDTIEEAIENVEDDLNNFMDEKGQPDGFASLDSNGFVPAEELPETVRQNLHIVSDYDERDDLNLDNDDTGDKSLVLDSGNTYIWDGSDWNLLTEDVWGDVELDWSNINNTPSEFTPEEHGNNYHFENYIADEGNQSIDGALEVDSSDTSSALVRNIYLSSEEPSASDLEEGEVWIQYEE